MLRLGALLLPADMVRTDALQAYGVQQDIVHTGRGLVVYERAVIGGEPVTLEATDDRGWLTRDQVRALHIMACSVGATYYLTLPDPVTGQDVNWPVKWRHHDPPAFRAEPLVDRGAGNPAGAADWYTAVLRLFRV